MRKWLFRWMLCFWMCTGGIYGICYGQATLDSLLAVLAHNSTVASPQKLEAIGEAALRLAHQTHNPSEEVGVFLALADAMPNTANAPAEAQIERLRQLQHETPLPEAAICQELGYLYFFQGMPGPALSHFKQAYRLAKKNDKPLAYEALIGQATVNISIYRHQESMDCLREARQLARNLSDTTRQVEVLNQLATIHFSKGELIKAEVYFDELLALRRTPGNERALASELHQVGGMFLHQGAFDKAQIYLIEALDLTVSLADSFLQTALLTDIAQGFLQQHDWNKAKQYAEEGLHLAQIRRLLPQEALNYQIIGEASYALGDRETAQQSFLLALDIYRYQSVNQTAATKLHILLAELFEEEADYASAIKYLEQALKHKSKHGDRLSMMDLQLMLAELLLKQGNPTGASAYVDQAYELSQALPSLSGAAQALAIRAEVAAQLGDYAQAYQDQLQYAATHDSLFNAEKTEIVHRLETKFQAAQKDQANAELAAEVAQQQLQIEQKTQQNYLLVGGIILLILGLILVWYTYTKRRQLLQEQVKTLEKEREVANLRAVISGEEQERQRIARELHDGLGSQLASIKMIVSSIQNDVPAVTEAASHQQAEAMLDHACREVREISHNLMPGTLERYGLTQAIKDLCLTIGPSHDLVIDCIMPEEEVPLIPEIALSIYRITQELLRNIVKHAQAQEVIVQLDMDEDHLQLTVEDDGVGFDLESSVPAPGIGLKNMSSRVAFLRGEIDLYSRPGEGTSVYISIPLFSTPTTP